MISGGRLIDTEIFTKYCHSSKLWEHKKDSSNYEDWNATQNCPINHKGSAASMIRMFGRSEREKELRYITYIGDGDTKTYQEVCKSKPCDNVETVKAECIGHVQNRVGSRLRSLKEKYKNQVLSDGKRWFGKGRLTKKPINTLQIYYDMAIRQNIGTLYECSCSIVSLF